MIHTRMFTQGQQHYELRLALRKPRRFVIIYSLVFVFMFSIYKPDTTLTKIKNNKTIYRPIICAYVNGTEHYVSHLNLYHGGQLTHSELLAH